MATIYIDKKPYPANEGDNLLKTCLSLGFDLPYFCWHPEMHSVGACRQCAIKHFKDENDTRGRIVMACMTPVQDGMFISIDDPEAKKFRAGVIEWLMANHPHDCPVCDEGGECHLQDMTVMTGHTYRRYRFRKRTHANQDLGPFLTHEMNRCIACYRCTRFYNDYARATDFGVYACHNDVFFGRAESGVLESAFAGNLVEICPTGVFNDKTQAQHYTRTWDLQTAPSVCVHCSLGCNTIPGERYGLLRRIRNRYNGDVNGYFLCDRGRYGYEFVNSDRRTREPRWRTNRHSGLNAASKGELLEHLREVLLSARRVIGIGSPRASLEANFTLRTLVGRANFYSGVDEVEQRLTAAAAEIMRTMPSAVSSLNSVKQCDAVLVLGEDIPNAAPVLGLNVLQSIRQQPIEGAQGHGMHYWDDTAVRVATERQAGPLFVITAAKTGLDAFATRAVRAAPDNIARLGFAIAHLLDAGAPVVYPMARDAAALAEKVADVLKEAKRPVVISGVTCRNEAVLRAAANIVQALLNTGKQAFLCLVLPECNSLGLCLMEPGSVNDAFEAALDGRADVAVVLENDLYRRFVPRKVDAFLHALRCTVVVDHLFHRTALKADVVLPAATFAECDGTLVNNEGRAQRYFQVFPASPDIQAGWRWLKDMMDVTHRPEARSWRNLDAVLAAMARSMPDLQGAVKAAPSAAFRVAGMKIAREHERYSGRTSIRADRSVHEPRPPADVDSPFNFSMEGYGGMPPPAVTPRFWAPGWNSVQSLNKFQAEVGGPLRGGNPGIRLMQPQADGRKLSYFDHIPAAFHAQDGKVLVVPLYHVFGSDEMSMLTPGIAGRAPAAYIALSNHDMAALNVREGDMAVVHTDSDSYRLPVRGGHDLPPHVAGLPQGIPACPPLSLPAWLEVRKG